MSDYEQLLELLKKLKAAGHDVRLVFDVPKDTLSFQGCIKMTQDGEKK